MKTRKEWEGLILSAEEEFERWWDLQSDELKGDKVHTQIGFVAGYERGIKTSINQQSVIDAGKVEAVVEAPKPKPTRKIRSRKTRVK